MKKFIFTFLYIAFYCFFGCSLIAQEIEKEDKPIEDNISSEDKNNIKQFSEIVKEDWKKWAGEKNEVNRHILIAHMANANFKEESAAALVALIYYMKNEKIESITYEEAINSCSGKNEETYKQLVLKLRNANRSLFANGKPTFSLMKQGPEGDCYFFSGAGWIAKYRPEVIIKAIEIISNNKYNVRFPNGDEAEISEPTDAEIAFNYSVSTLSDGLWMPVLEKALGVMLKDKDKKHSEILDPTARVDIGGGPGPDVKRWTGNDVELFKLSENDIEKKVREALIKMEKHNLMSQALVLKRKGKIIGDHVYAVMGFNEETNMLTVWNPWGTDYKHEGEDSPENGYNRKDGIFKISLKDFIYLFAYLAIEKK
jgi:hypothetical protein